MSTRDHALLEEIRDIFRYRHAQDDDLRLACKVPYQGGLGQVSGDIKWQARHNQVYAGPKPTDLICTVYDPHVPSSFVTALKHARLIAAAPELLRALKLTYDLLIRTSDRKDMQMESCRRAAETAIAKADRSANPA